MALQIGSKPVSPTQANWTEINVRRRSESRYVTGITGSQPRSGDPSGAGTLTQRLSVVFNNTNGGSKMAIAISGFATVALVVAYQFAKEIVHREQVARDCWMARNSIQRTKR
jgi:hypothetical protein